MKRGDSGVRQPVQVISGDGSDELLDASPGKDRRRRRLLLALGSAVVLFGVFVMAGLVGGDAPSVPTTTPARLLSDPGSVVVDATTNRPASSGQWAVAELDAANGLGDVMSTDSGFIAVGRDFGGLGLWTSRSGEFWELSTRLEAPAGVGLPDVSAPWGLSQLQLLEWEGSTLVFAGAGDGWTVWLDGEFRGLTEAFGGPASLQVVAGEQLLAAVFRPPDGGELSEPGNFESTWFVSGNGVEWVPISPNGLPETGVILLGSVDGFYYAAGSCWTDQCPPTPLYRSDDGTTWQAVDVPGIPQDGLGQMTSIAPVGEQLLGVGALAAGAGWEPAMWSSSTGEHWTRVPLADAFRLGTTTVELVAANRTVQGIAVVSINGVEFELPKESAIDTDIGRLAVTSIGNDSIVVNMGTEGSHRLDPGIEVTLHGTPQLYAISAHESRVAIYGTVGVSDDGVDSFWWAASAVWLSEDGGVTWEMSIIDEPTVMFIDSIALSPDNISMIGYTEDGLTAAWHHEQNSQATEQDPSQE